MKSAIAESILIVTVCCSIRIALSVGKPLKHWSILQKEFALEHFAERSGSISSGHLWCKLEHLCETISHNHLGSSSLGSDWVERNVLAFCDNSAVVAILRSGDCKNPEVMHFMRCLAFLKAKFQFVLFSSHIGGKKNDLANALPRNDSEHFFTHYPQEHPKPTPLPPELLDLTIIQKPDWTSQRWTNLWCAIFKQDWLLLPDTRMTQQSEDS